MSRLLQVLLALTLVPPAAAQELEIVHVHVGQGDATLVLGPADPSGDRVTVLADAGDITFGGDPDGGLLVLKALRDRGIDRLDFVVLSHYDSDHLGGLVTGQGHIHGSSALLGEDGAPGAPGDDDGDGEGDWLGSEHTTAPDPEELATGDDILVGSFVDRGDAGPPSTRSYDKYRAMAEARGNRISLANRQDVEAFEINLGGGARMVAVAANGFVRGRPSRVANTNTENERSLAFLIRFGGFDYLIGGDLIGRAFGSENAEVEQAVGEFLVDEGVELDVLHVNHHGGNNASAFQFLEMVRPEVAVISLGNGNPHGHPHPGVLERLAAAGVGLVYQTAWGSTTGEIPEAVRRRQAIFQGDVVISTDGTTYTVSTARRFGVDGPGS